MLKRQRWSGGGAKRKRGFAPKMKKASCVDRPPTIKAKSDSENPR